MVQRDALFRKSTARRYANMLRRCAFPYWIPASVFRTSGWPAKDRGPALVLAPCGPVRA
jgi:hypothetical protein